MNEFHLGELVDGMPLRISSQFARTIITIVRQVSSYAEAET